MPGQGLQPVEKNANTHEDRQISHTGARPRCWSSEFALPESTRLPQRSAERLTVGIAH